LGKALLERVLGLNERPEIKDRIIENVAYRLRNDMKDLDDEDNINYLVNEEHRFVTEQAIKEAEAQLNTAHQKAYREQKIQFDNRLQSLRIEYNAEVDKIKEEVDRTKQELINRKKEYADELKDVKISVKQEVIDDIVTRKVEKAARNKRKRGIIICILGAIIPIVILILILVRVIDIPVFDDRNAEIIVSIVITVVVEFLLTIVLFQGVYCSMELEKLKEIVRPKIEKKYH